MQAKLSTYLLVEILLLVGNLHLAEGTAGFTDRSTATASLASTAAHLAGAHASDSGRQYAHWAY